MKPFNIEGIQASSQERERAVFQKPYRQRLKVIEKVYDPLLTQITNHQDRLLPEKGETDEMHCVR